MSNFFFMHPYSVRSYTNLEQEVRISARELGELNTGTSLVGVAEGQIVIPRYRFIPFGKEIEIEVTERGASLINTYSQHRQIADQSVWWRTLHEVGLTPQRYTLEDLRNIPEGEYFVKGETNSLKNNWFNACYAPNKERLVEVVRYNMMDSVIGSQTIYIQPFQRYRQIAEAVDGRPVFNERRAFVYKGDVLSHAPYWSSFDEALTVDAYTPEKLDATLKQAIAVTEHLADFYVIDLAETETGDWKVVELNDGCMSGLSENTPEGVFGTLYRKHQAE